MIHMFLEEPRWEDTAMERAKLAFLASVKWVQGGAQHGLGIRKDKSHTVCAGLELL